MMLYTWLQPGWFVLPLLDAFDTILRMVELFWTPLSINILVAAIMASLLSGLFVAELVFDLCHGRSWVLSGILALTMAAASIAAWLQFGVYVLSSEYSGILLPWVSVFGSAAMGFYVFFSARFLQEKPVLGGAGLWLAGGLGAIIVFELYVAIRRAILLRDGLVEFREAWLDVPIALGFVIAMVFFFMHLARALCDIGTHGVLRGVVPAIKALFLPFASLPAHAGAARAFFYAALFPVAIAAVSLVRSYGVINWSIAELLISWVLLLTFGSFALAYLNFIPTRSTFQVKLVGATLIAILSILSGISWLIGPVYINAYENPDRIRDTRAIRFAPLTDGAYRVSQIPYQEVEPLGHKVRNSPEALHLDFDFPYFGRPHRSLYAGQSGMVGFDHLPLWRHVQYRFGPQPAIFLIAAELIEGEGAGSGIYFQTTPEQTTITWHNMVSAFAPDAHYGFQLRLYPSGTIEFLFAQVPQQFVPDLFRAHATPMMSGIVPGLRDQVVDPVNLMSALPLTIPAGHGVVANFRQDFRLYLNRIYSPTAKFVLVSILIVLLVFPLFFRTNLSRPLQRLVLGVRGILDGNLKARVPVSYSDEIGFLASSFNEMADAQRDFIHNLEDKVKERTAEAVGHIANNARLEERNHLMRELHDAVSQKLFSANLIAESLPLLRGKGAARTDAALAELRELNREALEEMRHILLHLHPESAAHQSFGSLLQALIGRMGNDCDVQLKIGADATLPANVQRAFLRIAQEALNNIVKHAGVSRAIIRFDGVQGQAMLTIRDEGRGFDPTAGKAGKLGLGIMRSRMDDIGGTLECLSSIDNGTTINAIWYADAQD